MIAEQVFGRSEIAEGWLKKPSHVLDDHAPCKLLRTPAGYDDIYNQFMRLDHGILS